MSLTLISSYPGNDLRSIVRPHVLVKDWSLKSIKCATLHNNDGADGIESMAVWESRFIVIWHVKMSIALSGAVIAPLIMR